MSADTESPLTEKQQQSANSEIDRAFKYGLWRADTAFDSDHAIHLQDVWRVFRLGRKDKKEL